MRTVILIPVVTLLLELSIAAPQSPKKCIHDCPKDDQKPEICTSFSGPLSFRYAGEFIQGRVVVQDWQIANGEKKEIRHQGLLIVHLRGGSLVTEIEGQRKAWREGSFWSVPAGKHLIVHTARDSVMLQTVDFIIQ
jgi:hypothetical protein